jgi:hypothetical protein
MDGQTNQGDNWTNPRNEENQQQAHHAHGNKFCQLHGLWIPNKSLAEHVFQNIRMDLNPGQARADGGGPNIQQANSRCPDNRQTPGDPFR